MLAHLHEHVPLDYWAVSRVVDDREVFLQVTPNDLELRAGDSYPWDESMCVRMWEHGQARIAPDVALVPSYFESPMRTSVGVGCYVGIPVVYADGELFGTLCGLDRHPQQHHLSQHEPLLILLGDLLSCVMQSDVARVATARVLESTRLLAHTDSLTGLLNRRGWDQVCVTEQIRHHRFGDHASIVVVDLDGLKQVNDAHGHASGDAVIQKAAAAITRAVRDVDRVARTGGDEFAVLCPQTSARQVTSLLDRLRASLDDNGIASSLGAGTMDISSTMLQAQADADERMYADKTPRAPRST